MDSLFVFRNLAFWRGRLPMVYRSSPKSSGHLANDLAAFCIDSTSVGFAILPCILTSTFWLYFPWDQRLNAGKPRYRSLIPWLHRVPATWAVCLGANFIYGPHEGQSLVVESDAKIVDTFLLALSITCGLTVLDKGCSGSGGDLERTENTSTGQWSQATPVTMEQYAAESWMRNFRDFTQIVKNAKFKPSEIFSLYGSMVHSMYFIITTCIQNSTSHFLYVYAFMGVGVF